MKKAAENEGQVSDKRTTEVNVQKREDRNCVIVPKQKTNPAGTKSVKNKESGNELGSYNILKGIKRKRSEICFWCQLHKRPTSSDEVALAFEEHLFYRLVLTHCSLEKNDGIDYEPCYTCKEGMKKGITLIVVSTEKRRGPKQLPVQEKPIALYPTGTWAVITEEAVKCFFPDIADQALRSRIMFIKPEVFDELEKIKNQRGNLL